MVAHEIELSGHVGPSYGISRVGAGAQTPNLAQQHTCGYAGRGPGRNRSAFNLRSPDNSWATESHKEFTVSTTTPTMLDVTYLEPRRAKGKRGDDDAITDESAGRLHRSGCRQGLALLEGKNSALRPYARRPHRLRGVCLMLAVCATALLCVAPGAAAATRHCGFFHHGTVKVLVLSGGGASCTTARKIIHDVVYKAGVTPIGSSGYETVALFPGWKCNLGPAGAICHKSQEHATGGFE